MMHAATEQRDLAALGWLATLPEAATRAQADVDERALVREVALCPDRFQLLYNRYYERILNFFYRRTRERAAAEDLTSQVFLSTFEYLSEAERDLPFRPWLYRVATNAWISHERKRLRWGGRLVAEVGRWLGRRTETLATDALSAAERAEFIRDMIMALPQTYREPLLLRCYDDLTDAEIGETLGLKPASVRSRISRGLAMLRERVKPNEADHA